MKFELPSFLLGLAVAFLVSCLLSCTTKNEPLLTDPSMEYLLRLLSLRVDDPMPPMTTP